MERAQVLIVEDETLIAKSIESMLKRNGMDVTDICTSGEEAIKRCEQGMPDLVLMDIKLAGALDGIQTAAVITRQSKVPVIYITDFNDASTFRKARTTAPVNFITKPFTEATLIRAAEMAIFNANKTRSAQPVTDSDFVFLKTGNQTWARIEYNDILFLEADRVYCKIVCNNTTHKVSVNLSAVHDQLNKNIFLKIHRSYVVNLKNVRELSGSDLILNGYKIPVSDVHRAELMNKLKILH